MKNSLHINKQCLAAVIFIILSVLIIGGTIARQGQGQDEPSHGQTSAASDQTDHDDIPAEVIREVDGCASRELEYVSYLFPERSYCEYKLESVSHVLTCRHVENEIFEVYGITCSYRRDYHEDWETVENAANSFLVFRTVPDKSMERIGESRSHYEPGTEDFENDVHEVLMDADNQYTFKLCANDSLEQALEGTLNGYLEHLIPGDYVYFGWKQLARETESEGGQVYGILSSYTYSGSPMIYSEQTDRSVPAIYSVYLLPIRVTYQHDKMDRYVVTAIWEPSKENYELDVRENFPAETADLILKQFDQYVSDMLEESGITQEDLLLEFFPGGPVWPAYSFNAELDDATLCGLAGYYPYGDIYYKSVGEEVIRRFYDDPAELLNGLGVCNESTIKTVCKFLVRSGIDIGSAPILRSDLTDEGMAAYKALEKIHS